MQSRFIFQKIGVACWLLALSVGCSRTNTDSGVTPDEACRVQTETFTDANQRSQTTYTYDATGGLTSSLKSLTYANGIETYRNEYQYNANGFLTQYVLTTKSGSSESKTTDTYQYENNRLIKHVSVSSPSAITTKTYTYDAAGVLAKHGIETSYAVRNYLFTNGVLTSAETKSSGKTYPATVVNGRLTDEFLFDLGGGILVFLRSEYNAAGQLIKDYLTDAQGKENTVFSKNTREYTTQTLKNSESLVLKGHPVLSIYGTEGFISRLVAVYPKGYESQNQTIDYQYKTNAKGYITEQTATITGYQPRQFKTVYTFSNCQ
jgi:hypothetical protein